MPNLSQEIEEMAQGFVSGDYASAISVMSEVRAVAQAYGVSTGALITRLERAIKRLKEEK